MRPRTFPALLAAALVVALVVPPPGGAPLASGGARGATATAPSPVPVDGVAGRTPEAAGNDTAGAILAVYPDPVAEGDRGEYVVVAHPAGAGWTLTDGETSVSLPPEGGRVVVTPDPDAVDATLGDRVVAAERLRLANGGERLRLTRDGRAVDEVRYGAALENEVYRPAADGWTPRGATDFPVATTGPTTVRAFALPDAPAVTAETVAGADRRVLLGAYTVTSWRVARALVAARERGAEVRVLVEGGPVGGMSRRQARVLDWLAASGVRVAVLAGPRARYAFHHAKYAVVDDRALVLTENLKPAGTGGRASRGWGVVVDDPGAAAHLAAVFRADTGWRDTTPWAAFRADRTFEDGAVANGSYPARFEPRSVEADAVRVVVAPDNAEREVVETVRAAEESVLVQQVSVGGRDQPFVRAALAAARDGARVRVLLSSAWYVREDNRRLVDWLTAVAREEGLDVEARLAEPRSRYARIHAKGVVVDDETVVLGSLNWNNHSARENREVVLVVEGEEVGDYYGRLFRADWRGGTRRLPAGVAVAGLLAGVGCIRAARRVSFER